jgi:hypothetical protein
MTPELKQVFDFINGYLPLLMQVWGVLFGIWIAAYIVQTVAVTFRITTEKIESYEEAMSHYDDSQAAEPDLRSGVTLDDLMQSVQADGEIPDRFLGGR